MDKTDNIPIKQEKAIAFIVARLSSSRLPAKQFKQIGNRSILNWIIANLQSCQELNQIVIATVAEEANLPLKTFAAKNKIPCFWYHGEVDHVTTRLRKAAEAYNADICLLISADCPLVYAPAIDQLICEMRSHPKADHLCLPPDTTGKPVALEGVQVARKKTWQLADDLADRPELKEHQFPVIGMRPEFFSPHSCQLAANLYAPPHRFSVDTQADLEFMNRLYDQLTKQNLPFTLPEVLKLMQKDPQLAEINQHVHQRQLVEPNHTILFAVDSGIPFGLGHLMRSLELAAQLTERQGWPVTFLIDDDKTAELLQQRGIPFKWGAFARTANTSAQYTSHYVTELLSEYSLLLLDIYDQRGPEAHWRKELKTKVPIAVIDNRRQWAKEADLIITPGVTAKSTDTALKQRSINHLAGKEYIILRREVQREVEKNQDKQLDLLVYLHNEQQQEAVQRCIDKHQINAKFVRCFTPEMPHLIAQARYYLSGFGISFYEALALNTIPICWPDSDAHRHNAISFYNYFDLPSYLLSTMANLQDELLPLLHSQPPTLQPLQDGTPQIVTAIATLVNNNQTKG